MTGKGPAQLIAKGEVPHGVGNLTAIGIVRPSMGDDGPPPRVLGDDKKRPTGKGLLMAMPGMITKLLDEIPVIDTIEFIDPEAVGVILGDQVIDHP